MNNDMLRILRDWTTTFGSFVLVVFLGLAVSCCTSRQGDAPTVPAEEACADARSACLQQHHTLGCATSPESCGLCTYEGEVDAKLSMDCTEAWLETTECVQLSGWPTVCQWTNPYGAP